VNHVSYIILILLILLMCGCLAWGTSRTIVITDKSYVIGIEHKDNDGKNK